MRLIWQFWSSWIFLGGSLLTSCGPQSERVQSAPLADASRLTAEMAAEHAEAERARPAAYLDLATGRVEDVNLAGHRNLAWPLALQSIGHNSASYQNYGTKAYFHHGLDIRGEAGGDVRASAGGKVVNIENYVPGAPAYWEVAILDEQGFLWQYHHVDRSTIPQQIFDAWRNGTQIPAGTKLGNIYSWPMTAMGEPFHHIHLNVLGQGGEYLSPFLFLQSLDDTRAPEVIELGLLKNGQPWHGRSINGSYSLYAVVHDLILHDKFVVPAHSLSYRLDGGRETSVWSFDTLPGGSSDTDFVHDFFLKDLSCGDYNCRKQAVNLGFTKQGLRAFPASAGRHAIEIIARDYAGNKTVKTFTWLVN